ncbi:MAG: hypothetical protein GY851_08075 [bacterium]|nr:hypothetical protein [bacterium]
MSSEMDKVLKKLETAVEAWTNELGGAAAPSGPEPDRADMGQAVAEFMGGVKDGLAAVHGLLVQESETSQAMAGRVDRLEDTVAALRQEVRSLLDARQGTLPGIDPGVDGKEAMRASELAQELADALRERDEVRSELEQIGREVHALREGADARDASSLAPSEAPAVPSLKAFDDYGRRRRMGEVLVSAGVLTQRQLDEALTVQHESPQRRLGAILIEKGFASDVVVARLIALQLGLQFLELETMEPEESALASITRRLAVQHECMPVRLAKGNLELAMANPLDLIAIEDVELASGAAVDPIVSAPSDIMTAIVHHYGPSYTR